MTVMKDKQLAKNVILQLEDSLITFTAHFKAFTILMEELLNEC